MLVLGFAITIWLAGTVAMGSYAHWRIGDGEYSQRDHYFNSGVILGVIMVIVLIIYGIGKLIGGIH